MLEWDDLRFVLAVAETGSLSGAARQLKISHATVFRRIGEIEKRIGVRLFDRRPDGYAPTLAGIEMRDLAARLREDIAAMENRLAGQDIRPTGTVRITTPDTMASYFLPPIFAAIRGENPGILLEIVSANQFLSLTQREADIAIRATDSPPETLTGKRIRTLRFGIYGVRARYGDGGPLVDLKAEDWVGIDESLAHLKAAKWIAQNVPENRICYRTNTLIGVMGAVRAGLGLGIIPRYMGDSDPQLVRCGPVLDEINTSLWLLAHRDIRSVPRVRIVLDALAAKITALSRSDI